VLRNRTDALFLILTGVFVAALAVVAGAISFAHMVELAGRHDQTGWKAYGFPVSVDGLEIVASLYLVARHRAGRPTGWVPWVALVVGTAASLAANVAVGGHDAIGRALAGWPALSMLAAVKLLFSMFDSDEGDQRTVRDDQRPSVGGPAVPGTDREVGRDGQSSSGTVTAAGAAGGDVSGSGAPVRPGGGVSGRSSGPDTTEVMDVRSVAHLIPAARAARAALARDRRRLSRDALADAIRDNGIGVSNVRASLLLKILKAEEEATTIDSTSMPSPQGLSAEIIDSQSLKGADTMARTAVATTQ
jgi:hypothetical protein